MVGIGRTTYGKYGACVEITDGVRSLLVTTDIGPRIIYFGMKGGENIMFEDKGDDINKGGKCTSTADTGFGSRPNIWTPTIPTTRPSTSR